MSYSRLVQLSNTFLFLSFCITSLFVLLYTDHETVLILTNIHKVKIWAQKKLINERKVRVLELFPVRLVPYDRFTIQEMYD